jgi:hypothetical protein
MSVRPPNDQPYELVSVQESTAPVGSEGAGWFSYRIAQGTNTITGYRQGTRTAIEAELRETVVALNERRSPRRGRVQLTQSRKPKVQAS